HSTVAAANAGLDMEMGITPGTFFTAPLKAAVLSGQVPMSRLNDMALRIVRTMFSLGIFDRPTPAQPGAVNTDVRRPADIALARTISESGTVLLKNSGGVLPLTGARKKVAVIGPAAGIQGAERFYNGGGSGHIPELGVKTDVVSPLPGIQRREARQHDTTLAADGSRC